MEAAHHLLEPVDHVKPFWRLVEAFRAGGRPEPVLLDSANGDARFGRFSYLGVGETATFEAHRRPDGLADVATRAGCETRLLPGVDPFEVLRAWRHDTAAPVGALQAARFPFVHGIVGWFGYEAGHCLESIPDTGRDDLGLPDLRFVRHEALLVRDHGTGRTWLSAVGRGPDGDAARRDADRIADAVRDRLASWGPPALSGCRPHPRPAPSQDGREDYMARVAAVQRDIRDGRVFECCLTRRLELELRADPWRLYGKLRSVNAPLFGAWLTRGDVAVLCASPERFLSLDRDRRLETRPIKGTRPSSPEPCEDAALHDELAASPKDRAENLMIVDLARNDLGRVCETGSVEVPELMAVERCGWVWQMVSTVRGRLRAGLDGIDAVRACFPGGSMTGAPKIEAMKMIDELEPWSRGVYAGSLGWLDDAGAMDLNIVIRTLVVRGGRAVCGIGGAVTADSDPADEWQETLDKAAALAHAVAEANRADTTLPR
ncbi:MAG: aminodeoxychorismate synthase component I [Candidatus Latescibacteria bacterium]|nr:aminodeoxychorismate synthase component I [Candidatus Latescibacterota bacterium]